LDPDSLENSGGTIKRTQTRAYDELSRLLRLVGAATQTTAFGYGKIGVRVELLRVRGYGLQPCRA